MADLDRHLVAIACNAPLRVHTNDMQILDPLNVHSLVCPEKLRLVSLTFLLFSSLKLHDDAMIDFSSLRILPDDSFLFHRRLSAGVTYSFGAAKRAGRDAPSRPALSGAAAPPVLESTRGCTCTWTAHSHARGRMRGHNESRCFRRAPIAIPTSARGSRERSRLTSSLSLCRVADENRC